MHLASAASWSHAYRGLMALTMRHRGQAAAPQTLTQIRLYFKGHLGNVSCSTTAYILPYALRCRWAPSTEADTIPCPDFQLP